MSSSTSTLNPGDQIRTTRLNRGHTVAAAASAAGIGARTLRIVEQTGRMPRPKQARAIADYLSLRVTDIWPITSTNGDGA